jgi:hypothetical protein
MPHMAPAAIVAAIVQVIQAVAPLIQQFLSSDDTSAEDYTSGKDKSYKNYQNSINDRLEVLQAAAKKEGIDLGITTNRIDSAEEAKTVREHLEVILAKIDSGDTNYAGLKSYRGELVNEIAALRKLEVDLTADGKIKDTGVLVPTPGTSMAG